MGLVLITHKTQSFYFELFVLSQHSLLEYIAILSNANTFKRPHILIIHQSTRTFLIHKI